MKISGDKVCTDSGEDSGKGPDAEVAENMELGSDLRLDETATSDDDVFGSVESDFLVVHPEGSDVEFGDDEI